MHSLRLLNIAMDNFQFIVDLASKEGDFSLYSYVKHHRRVIFVVHHHQSPLITIVKHYSLVSTTIKHYEPSLPPKKDEMPRCQDTLHRKDALSQVLESLTPSAKDDVALAKVLGHSQAPKIPRAPKIRGSTATVAQLGGLGWSICKSRDSPLPDLILRGYRKSD